MFCVNFRYEFFDYGYFESETRNATGNLPPPIRLFYHSAVGSKNYNNAANNCRLTYLDLFCANS